jgi:hypothetical protein
MCHQNYTRKPQRFVELQFMGLHGSINRPFYKATGYNFTKIKITGPVQWLKTRVLDPFDNNFVVLITKYPEKLVERHRSCDDPATLCQNHAAAASSGVEGNL